MAAIDSLTPAAQSVVKVFAFPFRSAPTADLLIWGSNQIAAGSSPAGLLDLLFNVPVPGSPFTSYSSISSLSAFTASLVDNLSDGLSVGAAAKAEWAAAIIAAAPSFATRGALTWAVIQFIEGYSGTDADLLALKSHSATRVERAAEFAQSPAGAVWDGNGFNQLLTPLSQPTYVLTADRASIEEGSPVTFTLQTTKVAAGTSLSFLMSGTGINGDDFVFGAIGGTFTVDANGKASMTIQPLSDSVAEGAETLRFTVGDNLAHVDVVVTDPGSGPPPTYTLTPSASTIVEGGSVTFTLTTTNVAAGTAIPYTLSGTGITSADIGGGSLTGSITVNASGSGTVSVTLSADGQTEGPEVLRLTLGGNLAQAETTITDATSTTPTYTLTPSAASVTEGGTVTFTLATTNVAAGTAIPYTLSGTGITSADIGGASLTGTITVNASGAGVLTLNVAADGQTEGSEVLRLTLGASLAQVETTINDTVATTPTYALSPSAASVIEGGTVTFTLTTTNVTAGTAVPYTLSGTGITATDIVGGSLTGSVTVNAAGTGVVSVSFVNDGVAESNEVVRMTLGASLAQAETTIVDSSTPPATSGPDTRNILDAMGLPGAGVPTTPAAGEPAFNSYLTYDLLDQSAGQALRMSVAALKASSPVAGGAVDTTNFKADRGNLPQVSNQSLLVIDLLGGTDRVDYSAESGRIVAPVSAESPAGTQYIFVNDNATDDLYNGATDRVDELRSVEQVVASSGGGVLDLTASGKGWKITYSRSFSPTGDVNSTLDRATHWVELTDLASGVLPARSFYEYRDAGTSASVTATPALWSVQGSDRDETLVFTEYQAGEARANALRGGNNRLDYSALTRSIITDVALTGWTASTSGADIDNASGRATASVTFSNGDGTTLVSTNAAVTSSYTPDNKVAAGKLFVTASGDREDAIAFVGTSQSKWIELGQSGTGGDIVTARLTSATGGAAVEFQRFEVLRDNGASDDVYDIKSISRAAGGTLRLTDGSEADHDMVRLAAEALGSTAVGGNKSVVNLATLNAAFDFDFDVLDVSTITGTSLSLVGTSGADDELVVGAIKNVGVATQFESLVLTKESLDLGSSFVLDLDADTVRVGEARNFFFMGSALSAGGLALGAPGQTNPVQPVATSLNMTILDSRAAGGTLVGGSGNDTLSGGVGNDTLRGGGGNDAIDAGLFFETWTTNLFGTPDASPANRLRIVISIDGTELTLTEAAIADTSYGDRNGAVVDGAGRLTIGTAMAALINANIAAINSGPGTGRLESAALDFRTLNLILRFDSGVDVNDVVTIALDLAGDTGTFGLGELLNANGGGGGNDRIVFEPSAAANGQDSIVNFRANSDKLDFSTFSGGPITASTAINAAAGGSFAGVATRAEFVFNKAGALSVGDFGTAAGPGKFVIADGARCIVAVTSDPTGARGDAANTPFSLYYVTNGSAAGLSDLTVSLVGTVSGPVELTLAQIASAMIS